MENRDVAAQRAPEVFDEHEQFLALKYFPALDGMRAVSIFLVVAYHVLDPRWNWVSGALGVTIFFGISGFLITTLLLREEARYGRISLKRFYVRRFFRIVPLYALALLSFSVLVLWFHLGRGGEGYLGKLPLFATFNGEFAGSGTFTHSWSLGIEEKFYILWPALAFGIPLFRRHRGVAIAILIPLAIVLSFLPVVGYFGIYLPIIGGCALALAANNRGGFRYVRALSRPAVTYLVFAALIGVMVVDPIMPLGETHPHAHTLFAIVAVLALPGALLSNTVIHKILASRPVVYYGTRAYGIYLFNNLSLRAVDKIIPSTTDSLYLLLVRFALVFVSSLIVADVLHRVLEAPLVRLGRRLAPNRPKQATQA
ncbi:MAG: hypothetical protein QOI59_6197 [Gammaproteobacteria bacterium]|jgi:peptidoglycan/LPS O-acetylase OafA/YrhL|nr:hypothetical protein [Gammaproteobacteria bacterium]